MNFFARLRQWLKRESVVQPRLTVYGQRTHRALYSEVAYEKVGWVRRCVDVIASNAAQVPVYAVQQARGKKAQRLPDAHPLSRLLARPNDEDDMPALIEATVIHQYLRGEALIEAASGKKGDGSFLPPGFLYVNSPQWIEKIDFDWALRKYERFHMRVAGSPFVIEGPNAIFSKFYNPSNPVRGIAPMTAAMQSADMHHSALLFNARFFDNAGILSLALEMDKSTLVEGNGLSREQRDAIREQLQGLFGGLDNAHSVGVFGPGEKIVELGGIKKDLSFGELLDACRREICGVIGVPEILVGIVTDANRANSIEQRAMFWEETEIPYLLGLQSLFNRKLAPRFGENLSIVFDYMQVPAMQANLQKTAEALLPFVEKNVMTVNEVRTERLNKPPVPWGDDRFDAGYNTDTEDEGDADPVRISPETAIQMVGEWKNAVTSRIREGAASPNHAFPIGREARKAVKKFGVPRAAAFDLARAVLLELNVNWDAERPADAAANLFDHYKEKIQSGARKGLVQ